MKPEEVIGMGAKVVAQPIEPDKMLNGVEQSADSLSQLTKKAIVLTVAPDVDYVEPGDIIGYNREPGRWGEGTNYVVFYNSTQILYKAKPEVRDRIKAAAENPA